MKKFVTTFEQFKIARHLLYWTVLIIPIAFATGSLVALFLWLLDWATSTRWHNMWLIFLLPIAGLLITFLYRRFGKNSDVGNNLIIEEIHQPGGGIPFRMAPLVLFSTIVTHLFGGSAGREGTAVQMGGSISSLFSKWYRLEHGDRSILLMCGISAGFGAVFGTPLAAAIFAMEVITIGKIKYNALIPCLIAGMLANFTCSLYNIHHTYYAIGFVGDTVNWLPYLSFDIVLLAKVIVVGVVFGLTSSLFSLSVHSIKSFAAKCIKITWMVPVVGGVAVVVISYLIGSFNYLGLGVTNPNNGPSIINAFNPGGVTTWSWFWKLLLTSITLGTGFKGGEVTPLFFIGAALGNVLAAITGAPVDLFAGLGFIAVFAGATNTPLACTLMGVELFGSENILYYAVACFTAYYFSGHRGIYQSQPIAVSKLPRAE